MEKITMQSNDPKIGTVQIAYTGELMKNQAPATLVDAHRQMKAVKDMNGEPMIFAISSDGVLYAYLRDKSSKTGWSPFDLSSDLLPGGVASTFEVAQGANGKLQLGIAIAPENAPEQAKLYFTPLITNDMRLTDWNKVRQQWHERPLQQNVRISNIIIGRNDGKSEPLALVVVQDGDMAKHYQINTNVQDNAWISKEYKIPENALQILDIGVGSVLGDWGVFALYRTATGKTLEFTSLPDPVYHKSSSYDFKAPGDITCFHILPGADDSYDLYAGGDGIYLFKDSKSAVTTVADASVISNIHRMQVEDDAQNVTIWTIHGDEVLQYTQGKKSDPKAWSRPFPISSKVTQMTAIRNQSKLTNELFVVKGDNTLRYIYQDPVSSLWRESKIPLPSLKKIIHLNTYTTHVSLRDGKERPLASKDVLLTASSWVYATINGESHSVDDKTPVSIRPDAQGNLTIIVEVDSISVPVFHLKADYLPEAVHINPGQKVIDGLKKIKSGDDLKTAYLPDGSKLIDKTLDDGTLQNAALAVNQLSQLYTTLPSDGSPKQAGGARRDASAPTTTQLFAFQHIDNKFVSHQGDDAQALYQSLRRPAIRGAGLKSMSAAAGEPDFLDPIWIDIGDFFSWVESGLVKAGEWFLNVLEAGAEFLINIGGKFFRFVINALEEVFKVIDWVLKETLGIDLEKFIKWLGFIFNWDDIKLTHRVLVNLSNQTINYGKAQVAGLETSVTAWFEDLKKKAKALQPHADGDTSVQDQRRQQEKNIPAESADKFSDFFASPGGNWGNYHLHHSGVFDQSYPDAQAKDPITAFFNDVVYPTLESIHQTADQLMKDFKKAYSDETLTFNQIVQMLAADTITGLLDAIEKIVVGLLKFMEDLITFLQNIINVPINIPFFSGLYKWLADDDLTILDAVCLMFAVPVTIFYKLIFEKAPFADGTYNFLSEDYKLIFSELSASSKKKPVVVRRIARMAATAGAGGHGRRGGPRRSSTGIRHNGGHGVLLRRRHRVLAWSGGRPYA